MLEVYVSVDMTYSIQKANEKVEKCKNDEATDVDVWSRYELHC